MRNKFYFVYMMFFIFLMLTCDHSGPTNPAPVVSSLITIGPEGGTYDAGNGITVTAPAGAVMSPTQIHLNPLRGSDAAKIFSQSGLYNKRVLAAIDGKPSGLVFAKPLSITLPLDSVWNGGLVAQFSYSEAGDSIVLDTTEITLDNTAARVTMMVRHFSPDAVAEVENASKKYCGGVNNCQCGRIYVKEETRSSTSYEGGTSCSVVHINGQLTYLDCPNTPTDKWEFDEITDGCKPRIRLQGPSDVEPDSKSSITAVAEFMTSSPIADAPLTFTKTGVGTIDPAFVETDAAGNGSISFYAGSREGTATIEARSTLSYYHTFVKVNGEVYKSPARTESAYAKKVINVKSGPTLELFFHDSLNGRCAEFAGLMLSDENYDPIAGKKINLSITGPAVLDSLTVTTDADGMAGFEIKPINRNGSVTVAAKSSFSYSINGMVQEAVVSAEKTAKTVASGKQQFTVSLECDVAGYYTQDPWPIHALVNDQLSFSFSFTVDPDDSIHMMCHWKDTVQVNPVQALSARADTVVKPIAGSCNWNVSVKNATALPVTIPVDVEVMPMTVDTSKNSWLTPMIAIGVGSLDSMETNSLAINTRTYTSIPAGCDDGGSIIDTIDCFFSFSTNERCSIGTLTDLEFTGINRIVFCPSTAASYVQSGICLIDGMYGTYKATVTKENAK